MLMAITNINAFDIDQHMYLGASNPAIWQDFDPEFGNYLYFGWPPPDTIHLLTTKFYLIGLTLPDLFIPQRETACRSLITQLHSIRDSITANVPSIPFLTIPFYISDTTYHYVQTLITFNGPQPNGNFQKLWDMAKYAKDQGWTPYEKALIYGAMAHVTQDLYVGTTLIPSKFGHGYVIDSDSAINKWILNYGEFYYELLSSTYIPNWNFLKPLFGTVQFSGNTVNSYKIGGVQYYFQSQVDGSQPAGWQELNFVPVQRFCQAATAVGYNDGSLTRERLESYLHGWAMLTFLIYGYNRDSNGNPTNMGGIKAHPDWSPHRIVAFWDSISNGNWELRQFRNFLHTANFYRHFPIFGPKIDKALKAFEGRLHEWDELSSLTDAWPLYLQTTDKFYEFYTALPSSIQNSLAREYRLAYANLHEWNLYASTSVPYNRNSYSGEVQTSCSLSSLYKKTIKDGPTDLNENINGIEVLNLSRKAGLTGGIYTAPEEGCPRQPAVLFMGFKKDANLVWSNINAYSGDPQLIRLHYDIILLPSYIQNFPSYTKISCKAKINTGELIDSNKVYITSSDPARVKDSITIDLATINSGTLYYDIGTAIINNNNFYTTMFSSKYDSAYNAHSEIQNNSLYQQWYNAGNSRRTQSQSPYDSCLKYWPYSLTVTRVDGWYLNSPHDLAIRSIGINTNRLSWYDESNWEESYEIERIDVVMSESRIFQSDPYSGTGLVTWDDTTAQLGHLYKYRLRAKHGTFYSTNWSNEAMGSVAYSNFSYPTAFNNQTKIVNQGNNVYLVYCGVNNGTGVVYFHSSDYGNTWDDQKTFDISSPPTYGTVYPSIAVDVLGRPHIFWMQWVSYSNNVWTLNCKHVFKDVSNWTSTTIDDRWGYTTNDPTNPPFSIPSVPFVIKGDSGYCAVILRSALSKPPELQVFAFYLYGVSGNCPYYSDEQDISESGNYKPNLVISNGRIVTCYNHNSDKKLIIRWGQSNAIVTNCLYTYNTSAISNGNGLVLAWYDGGEYIKLANCWWQYNNYTQPTPSSIAQVNPYDPYPAPKVINNDLIVFNDADGIFYSIRTNSNWSTHLISNFNFPNNSYPQSFIGPSSNYVSANRALNTYWTNLYDNKYCVISNKVDIPQKYYVACDMATGPNNGTHIMRVPKSKELYMVFQDQNKIYCAHSYDEGANWETEEIGEGLYPCVGLNSSGLPWIAYTCKGDLICKIKRLDGTYQETNLFHESGFWAGQPSIALATMPIKEGVLDYAYLVYPVYEGYAPPDPIPGPPDEFTSSYIYITLFDTLKAHTHLLDVKIDPSIPLSHPCVAVTPADLIHITWQQGDEIWYTTNTDSVTPNNWENVQWTEKYNLSNTPDFASEHPFVTSYGDIVSVVWKESDAKGIGEIIRKQRYVWEPSEYGKWKDPENLSNSPDMNSDYPQMASGNVILWQEQSPDGSYKVNANINNNILCLTPNANNVSYVHANALVIDPKAPEIQVYYCYTDEITQNELYEVKFDKYLFPEGIPGEQNEVKYYDGLVGDAVASPYCETRTGYIDYGDYKIDYGTNLDYLLKYLDPCKNYLFQAIVYQDTTGTIRQKLEVEDTLEATVRANPEIPETINIFISPNSYKEDLASALEIIKTRGAFAALADFKIYEYEVINDSGSSGGGGQQSAGTQNLPIPTILQSPKPNPFNNHTTIRFQIPAKTKVDLKVYNSTGRLVNTLVNNEMNPGYYTMSWNGKDDISRTQGNGIYFIRLKTKDYDATKKMVLVR